MRRDTDQTRLGRRGFLRRSALIAGTALASSGLARAAAGAPLLNEAGLDPAGKWVLFEGADGSNHTR
jgi:hypothetical protein